MMELEREWASQESGVITDVNLDLPLFGQKGKFLFVKNTYITLGGSRFWWWSWWVS